MQKSYFILGFKYRIADKTAKSEAFCDYFDNAVGQSRFVYNAVKESIDKKQENHASFPSKAELSRYLYQDLKVKNPWLKVTVDKFALEKALDEDCSAYAAFLKSQRRRPKFRSKYHSPQSFGTKITNGNIKFDYANGIVELSYLNPRTGKVMQAILHRSLEGPVKAARCIKDRVGDYHVVLFYKVQPKPLPKTEHKIGIDLGLKSHLTCSDGTVIKSQHFIKQNELRHKRTQRNMSSKLECAKKNAKEGGQPRISNNYLKERKKYAKLCRKLKNQRDNHCHQAASRIVSKNQGIVFETLNIKGMLSNHHPAQAVQDACFYKVKQNTKDKAKIAGRTVVEIELWFPRSQLCTKSKQKNSAVKDLSVSSWECQYCHTIIQTEI